jgi:predicted nucleic acid-binding protein
VAALVDTKYSSVWAYAEAHGLDVIFSEDFQHDRRYGSVRVVNPFVERA